MPDPSELNEVEPLYASKNVRVTRTMLTVKGKQYQIRNIDSIQETRIDPDTSVANSFIVIGVLMEMLIYIYALPDRLLVVGLFLIFVGIVSRNFLTPTYGILILTTGGQEIHYTSEKQEEIKVIRNAIEGAIDGLA